MIAASRILERISALWVALMSASHIGASDRGANSTAAIQPCSNVGKGLAPQRA